MRHHPDKLTGAGTTGGADDDDDGASRDRSREIFVRCRSALESLVECEDTGMCLLRSEVEERKRSIDGNENDENDDMSDAEFDRWFANETGHRNPFQFDIDPATMREVADMHADMAGSHGLDRDGGMWHLASLISSAVKSGKEGGAEGLLRLDAGNYDPTVPDDAGGRLDRRRKRSSTTSRSTRGGRG